MIAARAGAGAQHPQRRPTRGCSSTSGARPFDDIRVRRALNLATDRASSRRAAWRCSRSARPDVPVPARLRSRAMSPTARTPLDPSRGRGWICARRRARAPADRGVRDGGRARRRRACRASRRAVGRYFVSLLRKPRLPRARSACSPDERVLRPRSTRRGSREQMGVGRLGAPTSSAASTFIQTRTSPAASVSDAAARRTRSQPLRPRRSTRAVRRALAATTGADAAAAWAARRPPPRRPRRRGADRPTRRDVDPRVEAGRQRHTRTRSGRRCSDQMWVR